MAKKKPAAKSSSSNGGVRLTPRQQSAYDLALRILPVAPVVHVWARDGTGRTTVLRRLHETCGGALLTTADFLDAKGERHPLATEEAIYARVRRALRRNDTVIVDDWHLLTAPLHGCHSYPRSNYVDVPAAALGAYAEAKGRRLIFGTNGRLEDGLSNRAFPAGIDRFTSEDYAALLESFLGRALAARLDAAKVYRFAPRLTAHQIRSACTWLASSRKPQQLDTDELIEYLRVQRLTSNVELGEVRKADLRDLKGIDDVIEALEANVVLPFENDALAQELGLEPRRGILLAGPPGTGKTTIGRALAHRLRGKFFLIDGTLISGTQGFYGHVHRIFQAASDNAPSVIFIDDSDVIFSSGAEHGLYRYLLTMLDGLEGEGGKSVCVMMTAMDIGNLPPALVRSGRISLWLETRLPDAAARQSILEALLAKAPPVLRSVDVPVLLHATEGFTGADLERLVADAKALLAYDRARERPVLTATEYLIRAGQEVRRNQERYTKAEAAARQRQSPRPSWFDVESYVGLEGEDEENLPASIE